MKTKREILEVNGWEVIEGYCVGEKNPDYNNIVVSRKELIEFLKKKPDVYYWNVDIDWSEVVDEESAWDYFYDDWCDIHLKENEELDFEEWEKKMLNEEEKK